MLKRIFLIFILAPIGIPAVLIVFFLSLFITLMKSNPLYDFADFYADLF